MIKVKMIVGEYSDDFEKSINGWLEEHHMFKIVDIKYRRDCKSILGDEYEIYIYELEDA